jgi:Acetylornithine deacetylase/Succinyl-diaminopimelate desuccinylase and related deacylases
VEPEFQAIGFTTRWLPMDAVKRAPSFIAERKGTRGKRVLLIGHMDTVFEPSSPFQKFTREGDTATGPGTSDMKGGIVVMLSALKALHKAGELEGASITVFLTGDEDPSDNLSPHPARILSKRERTAMRYFVLKPEPGGKARIMPPQPGAAPPCGN